MEEKYSNNVKMSKGMEVGIYENPNISLFLGFINYAQ